MRPVEAGQGRRVGRLKSWQDDRGFGFITTEGGEADVFVHVSAFPRDGVRPHVGESLSYETERGTDGRVRAVRVLRPGSQVRSRSLRPRQPSNSKGAIAIGVVFAVGLLAYWQHQAQVRTTHASQQPATPMLALPQASEFRCDGRTHCSQMTSCAEAIYFLRNCPGVKMDGNNDGIPCEKQWC